MPPIRVHVKWSGRKFEDIELNTDEPASLFKMQLFSLTGVAPERQKIMIKGGMLKDDTDMSKLNVKDGHTFMMMGTAGELLKEPVDKPVFMEDMSESQVNQALNIPVGLQNLGNTCYMNATLQCLRAMPELQANLKEYQGAISGMDHRGALTASLRDLFNQMGEYGEGFPPLVFLQMLRQAFPQFAQMGQGGVPMQQDAEECWSQIVSILKAKLPAHDEKNFIERYMTGQLVSALKCDEAPDEEPVVNTEDFLKLNCHISINTNMMQQGIMESLDEKIEKNSPSLNRQAVYTKSSRVSRLPKYLTVQFMRFFWKPEQRVKAKILRKVKFPHELDATEFCTEELKKKLVPVRDRLREVENERLAAERAKSKAKRDQEVQGQSGGDSMAIDSAGEKKEASGEQAGETSASTDWSTVVDPELAADAGCNVSGQYELSAVLTHVGRSADSGHYIGWVRKEGTKEWWKFDDDKVSQVKPEDILKLEGGGDWHTAYILLYSEKKLE
ncbi:uncharacterized protein VTP21DRAFT_432 [Calcarisporiella thermophila]|uniref:uncharacterized protein n=1 Tax=Calcarisporiella thermophila TaxID=911321 RepID=UPI00374365D2